MDFPNQPGSASIRCDYEGVSFLARLSLEISHLAKGETIGSNVVEDNKTVIHRRTFGRRDERWLGRRNTLRCCVDSQRHVLRQDFQGLQMVLPFSRF